MGLGKRSMLRAKFLLVVLLAGPQLKVYALPDYVTLPMCLASGTLVAGFSGAVSWRCEVLEPPKGRGRNRRG